MLKVLIILILSTIAIFSYQPSQLYGEWGINRIKNVNGTINKEEESIYFHPATLQIVMIATLKRGSYLIKNLKIIADGIWKLNGDILVLVLQQVRVPEVEDVRGFNRRDINKLASTLRKNFLDDPIKILKIVNMDQSHLVLLYEDKKLETFRRK